MYATEYGIALNVMRRSAMAMLVMRQLVTDLMSGFVNTMKTVMIFPLRDKRNIKLYTRRTTTWCVVDGGAKGPS